MARRRRRSRFQWLPTQGLLGTDGFTPQTEHVSWDEFVINPPNSSSTIGEIRDVTFDVPRDNSLTSTNTETSMSDFLRSGYLLRRVVGNVFVHFSNTQGVGGDDLGGVIVTYAMFVARADEVPDAIRPIGSNGTAEIIQNYGPQNADNVREPYIFVKNWVLGNQSLLSARPTSGVVRFPITNASYGSAMEGTFLDQKTLRRVDGDNRLWHIVQARGYPLGEVHSTGSPEVVLTACLRYLGRPSRGTRPKGSF